MWQALRSELHPKGLEIVTVALDTGGADAVRPWLDAARPEHPALIDVAHVVDELLGIVNVPNAVWIDEEGMIVRPAEPAWPGRTPVRDMMAAARANNAMNAVVEAVGKMHIDPERYLAMVLDWVDKGAASEFVMSPDQVVARSRPRSPDLALAAAHFEMGQHLHLAGVHAAAVTHWREAHRLEASSLYLVTLEDSRRFGVQLALAGPSAPSILIKCTFLDASIVGGHASGLKGPCFAAGRPATPMKSAIAGKSASQIAF